ncbi:MAG: hypothetical protein ACOC5K_00775 [Chloroflexota bacterium]
MSTAGAEQQASAEVFDLGYQHYTGQRHGRLGSFLAIYTDGIRAATGLGRGVSQKLLAGLFVLLGMAPAVFIVIIAGAATSFGADRSEIDLPRHPDYYEFSWIILFLFAAAVAPALLCPDRRNSVLTLYAVRPITMTDYVFARWAAFLTVALVFVYAPQLLLLVAFALSADSPVTYVSDNWLDVPRIIASGGGIALLMTGIAMAAASFTTRRPLASVSVIGLLIIMSAVGGFGNALLDGDLQDWAGLLILPDVSAMLVGWIFGSGGSFDLSPWIYTGWIAVLIAGATALMWWRYRRLST